MAFLKIAESFISSLNVNDEFLAQQDGASKIKFCLKQMKKGKSFVRLPSASDVFQPKSDAKSIEARTKGNEFFKSKDYVSAMDWYNRSICFAPINSENLGMGYANRSAVFFYSGFYKFCLQNIDLALANNYPEKLKGKLENRKKECFEKMKTQEDSLVTFDKDFTPLPLSYPANKRIPMMIDGLHIEKSEQSGHFIRAKRDLKPGDILIIDNPLVKHIEKNLEYQFCANCWESNYLNLFPCNECTKAMFCSESCNLEATKRFHKYECKIKDGNFFENAVCPIGIALRATLQSFTMFDDLQDLQKLVKNVEEKKTDVLDMDYVNFTEQQQFRAVYSMNKKSEKSREILKFAQECAIVWHLLIQYTDLRVLLQTQDMEELFLNLLFHFYLVSFSNATTCIIKPSNERNEQYGYALFSLMSVLKHSCIPNAANFDVKEKCITVAVRSIKAGEQIFVCYSQDLHHGFGKLKYRQDVLKSQYDYDCSCKACLYDYPTIYEMTPSNMDFMEISMKEKDDLDQIFTKELAKKMLNKYIKHIVQYEKGIPSFERFLADAVFLSAIWNLEFGRPLNMQLKPI